MHGQQGLGRMQGSHRFFCSLLETRFMAPILIPRKSNVELGTVSCNGCLCNSSNYQPWLNCQSMAAGCSKARFSRTVLGIQRRQLPFVGSSNAPIFLIASNMIFSKAVLTHVVGKTSYLPLAEDSWLSDSNWALRQSGKP